jgi:hypothetical protein
MRKSKLQSKIYGNNGAPFVSVVRSEKQEALARKAANKKNSCRFCERVFSLKKKESSASIYFSFLGEQTTANKYVFQYTSTIVCSCGGRVH